MRVHGQVRVMDFLSTQPMVRDLAHPAPGGDLLRGEAPCPYGLCVPTSAHSLGPLCAVPY